MKFQVSVRDFVLNGSGQDLVEYALLVAAVGLALIGAINQLSTAIYSLYSSIIVTIAGTGLAPPRIDY